MTRGRWASACRKVACALSVLVVLTACGPFGQGVSRQPDVADCLAAQPRPEPVSGLFVEPDDGLDPVVAEFAAAACAIDLSIYILSDDAVIAALLAAVDRGVRVRVMLEEFPFGGGGGQVELTERLERDGVEVRWSSTDVRFSHAKYAVIDRQVALVMNQNLTVSAFTANREFAVTTTDGATVAQAQAIFDRDWRHDPLDDPAGPLIVSPTNSRQRLLDLIDGADTSIDFYAEVIRDEPFMAALGAAERRGVAVRLIVDESMDDTDEAVATTLFDHGVEIRLSETLYIHAKLMIIDGDQAIVGSQNYTPTSLDDNRELAIVANDPQILARCAAIFERDWIRAVPGVPVGDG